MGGSNKEKKRTREQENPESMKPHHPFSQIIMAAPLPEFFQIPRIEKYDGLTDPKYHLTLFDVHMLIYGSSSSTDSIKCRVFPSTLTKYALRWFCTLPPNSINNFSQLTSKFLSRFVLSKVYPKSVGHLSDLKQRRNELLKDYLDRFNEEALQVVDDHLSPELQIGFIIKGLKSGPFFDSLIRERPLSLKELWLRSQCYVDQEIRDLHCNKRRRDYSSDSFEESLQPF